MKILGENIKKRRKLALISLLFLICVSYNACSPINGFKLGESADPLASLDAGAGTTTTSTTTTVPGATTTTTIPGATTTSTTLPPPTPAPPPPPGTDKWVKISGSGTGPYNPYFYCPVVRESTGEILLGWGGTFIFREDTGWLQTSNSLSGKGPTKDIGARENYGCAYDPDRDLAWIGDGAPIAYGFPNGPQSGEMTYDFSTETWTLQHKNYTTPKESISAGDGAFLYHKNKLWKFGSFSVGGGQITASRDLLTGQITYFSSTSIQNPPWTSSDAHSRIMYPRSGILNKSTGTFWTLADNNELWIRDMATGQWSPVTTTGDKPTSNFIVADYDEKNNKILAWAGTDNIVGVSPTIQVRATWILSMDTKVWRKSLSYAAGHVVPPGSPSASNVIRYDKFNQRMIMTVSGVGYVQVWAFYPGTPPP